MLTPLTSACDSPRAAAPAEIHTMSAILAETGQLKEARQMLIRYMALFNASEGINVSARYVLGRIAEQLKHGRRRHRHRHPVSPAPEPTSATMPSPTWRRFASRQCLCPDDNGVTLIPERQ